MTKYLSNDRVIEILAGGGTRAEQAKAADVGLRHWQKRVKALKASGELNMDGNVPGNHPGEGMRLKRVGKQIGPNGDVSKYHTTEVPIGNPDEFVEPDGLENPGRRVRLSTYRGEDGNITGQWDIRVWKDDDEKFLDFLEALNQKVEPVTPVPAPHLAMSESLITNVVLSDCHIGSMSWKPQDGANWDLKIAEDLLVQSFVYMIDNSPRANRLVLTLNGDWLHYDKPDPVTTLSGNILSSDGRQEKMVDVGLRVLRKILGYALTKYMNITLLIAEGNHDLISSMWMRKMFKALYENEPRVDVIDSPFPYYCIRHGNVFLGYTHGHLRGISGSGNPKLAQKKGEELVAIFADEFADEWSAKKRYIHTGHFHSKVEVEPRGAQVIQHPTMEARDNYPSRYGWGNLRNALGITYHEQFGETARIVASPDMFEV